MKVIDWTQIIRAPYTGLGSFFELLKDDFDTIRNTVFRGELVLIQIIPGAQIKIHLSDEPTLDDGTQNAESYPQTRRCEINMIVFDKIYKTISGIPYDSLESYVKGLLEGMRFFAAKSGINE